MGCQKCKDLTTLAAEGHAEFYTWNEQGWVYCFNVDRGYAIAAMTRMVPEVIHPRSIAAMLDVNDPEPEHVEHVADRWQWVGLVGRVPQGGHLLLDGAHRALYCLKYNKDFHVYILDADQTNLIRIPGAEKMYSKPGSVPTLWEKEDRQYVTRS